MAFGAVCEVMLDVRLYRHMPQAVPVYARSCSGLHLIQCVATACGT